MAEVRWMFHHVQDLRGMSSSDFQPVQAVCSQSNAMDARILHAVLLLLLGIVSKQAAEASMKPQYSVFDQYWETGICQASCAACCHSSRNPEKSRRSSLNLTVVIAVTMLPSCLLQNRDHTNLLQGIARSTWFDNITLFIVFLNAVWRLGRLCMSHIQSSCN